MKVIEPAALPVRPHVFEPADTADHRGVRDCRRCPLSESRKDVHTLPSQAPHVSDAEARRLGEHWEDV